jgi:integrase
MGKVGCRPTGYLYYDFYSNGIRYRESSGLKNTAKNLKQMKDTMGKIDAEIKLGTFDYGKYFPGSKNALKFRAQEPKLNGTLFEEYANRWYDINKVSWKPSTRMCFRSILDRHIIPAFKGKALADIKKWTLKAFRTDLARLENQKGQKISNRSINSIMQILQMVMNEAADEHDLDNPFSNLKRLKVKKSQIQPLSLDEVFKFLEHVVERYYNYYVVRFFTGMRTSEIDGLKWEYVDFKKKKIYVRDTWQRRQWVSPKTESSVRDIDMSQMVEDALRKQWEITGGGVMVFCTRKGDPLNYTNVTKDIWYPTLKKAGLAPRVAYQSRHTAATLWLASGENPEWVARQLGHANTEMLFTVYSRYIPNLTRNDGSAFQKLLDKTREEHNNNNGKENNKL